MPRYFLEVAYKGTSYSGFQAQKNANTIQAEVERAFAILQKQEIILTGSSRTDSGVHALQNFFHFDYETEINPNIIYNVNAVLPDDIVIKNLHQVSNSAHCRFDAISRKYNYYIYCQKDPFLKEQAFFFPYKLDIEKMKLAALLIKDYTDFTSFSKRNTQVKTFHCQIFESSWSFHSNTLVYEVRANRFLRGMVRALVATMLKVGRGKLSLVEFKTIIVAKDCSMASFAVPAHGLFLKSVAYPEHYNYKSKYQGSPSQ